MSVNLELDGVHLSSLIDTGAGRSMMRTDVWRKLCYARGVPAITRPGLRLRALSGHELVTKGTAKVLVHKVMCEFYIVDALAHDALIGDDVHYLSGHVN